MMFAALYVGGAATVFGYFAWAVRYHFVSATMPGRMRLISALALAAFLVAVVSVAKTPPAAWWMSLSAAGVFTSASVFHAAIMASKHKSFALAFDPVVPLDLVETGPYAYVRHPFYLSYILFWASLTMAAPIWPMVALTLVLTGLYIQSALQEERAILASPRSANYRKIMARSGFLVPRLSRQGAG